MKMKWTSILLIMTCIPLVFELTVLAGSLHVLDEIDRSKKEVVRLMDVAVELSRVVNFWLKDSATIASAKLEIIPNAKRTYDSISDRGQELKHSLAGSMQSQPKEFQDRLAQEYNAITESRKAMKLAARLMNDGNFIDALKMQRSVMQTMKKRAFELVSYVREMVEKSDRQFEKERQQWRFLTSVLIAAFPVSVIIVTVIAASLNRTIVRKLGRLKANAERLERGEPPGAVLAGDDQFSQLDHGLRSVANVLAESRRREQTVIDGSKDLICSLDDTLIFTQTNSLSMRIFGCLPENLVGRPLIDFVFRDDRARLVSTIERLKAAPNAESSTIELRLLGPQVEPVDTVWSVSWSAADQRLFCIVHDASDERKAEREREEFVGMISHDLRTPLTSVQMSLELICSGVLGKVSESTLDSIKKTNADAEKLVSLVSDLLDIQKLDAGQMDISIKLESLSEMLDAAAHAVRNRAEEKNISINAGPTNWKVFVDKEQFVRAIVNLLANSLEFAPQNSRVDITAHKKGQRTDIWISDSGPLVSSSARELMFERYHEDDLELPERAQKNRLSLALAKAIVVASGGSVFVEPNDEGKFVFHIDIASSTIVQS